MSPDFDKEIFKRAIAQIESNSGKLLTNPNSSAAGKYHFLYNNIKNIPLLKGVSKREFNASSELQEKVMDMALSGTLPGYSNYHNNSYKLKEKYNSNLRADEIAALTHLLGMGDIEKYLANPDGFTVPGKNATVRQYVGRFNRAQGTQSTFDLNMPNSPPVTEDSIQYSMNDIENAMSLKPISDRGQGIHNIINNESFNQPQEEISKTISENFAEGGDLNSEENNNTLTEFNNGGTHEENPNGGIPQGVGVNGKPNLVEEGETKHSFDDGDYVFSNRITL